MAIDDRLSTKPAELSLVQNRLTVAALALTVLVFAGSFSLSLSSLLRPNDYRTAFAQVEVPLAVGVVVSLLSIASFLFCQQASDAPRSLYGSRQWWFSVGHVLLSLALSQAMSASLTEIVFGIGQASRWLAWLIGLGALLVWWLLLVFGPVIYIVRVKQVLSTTEVSALVAVYVITLTSIWGANAEIYRVQNGHPATLCHFAVNFLEQTYQPLTWYEPWPEDAGGPPAAPQRVDHWCE